MAGKAVSQKREVSLQTDNRRKGASTGMDILQKEAIIAAFEREKINVEITENKKG